MRFVTWNIQWGRGIDGRVDLARTAAVLHHFDADVIALQEVAIHHEGLPGSPEGDQFEQLRWFMPEYEAVYGAGSDLPDGQGGRRLFGQAVFARYPLLQVFRHLLPWPADAAVPSMQRVALEAVIAIPTLQGGALRLITTHLEYYSPRQRAAQVEALRALHAEGWHHARQMRPASESDAPFAVLPRGEVTVLCGDCNFSPAMPEYQRLQAPFAVEEGGVPRLVDAWTVVHGDAPHAPTVGVHRATFTAGPECFDFFFVSENVAGRLRDLYVYRITGASDHQPVILEISG